MELVRTVEEANNPNKASEVENQCSTNKRMGGNYLNFKEVFSIFPDVNLAVLCKLSELRDISPTKILSLVPSATKQQMSMFLQL